MFTRRRFIVSFSAFAASARAFADWPIRKKKPLPPTPVNVYFGTDTNKGVSKGIYQSTFDPTKGQLTPPVLAATTARPSFLAVSPPGPGRRSVYAVNAINDPAATVTTFTLDPTSGSLHQAGQVPSGGAGPAYVSVDSTGHAAFVADYMGSAIASYRIQPDGTLSQPVERLDFKDHQKFGSLGPVSARQDVPHPHCVTVSPDDRFLLVCDLGTDRICVFYIHPETGQLSDPHLFTNDRPGCGPRHLAAGSTASAKLTRRSIAASGRPHASATPLRAFSSIPASPSRPSRQVFLPQRIPPPNSLSHQMATSSMQAIVAKTHW